MAKIDKFTLDNGLQILLYPNPNTPFIATHLLFKAGSKYEPIHGSGLAHLLEHLMFSGTKNVANYDKILQKSGASNNAYTSWDLSAYFTEVPANNIDTILFVESDRMRNLTLQKEHFLIQKKVVIEEFKEHFLTRPYGDLWHLICALSYKKHPYRYPVIGKDLDMVNKIELNEVHHFYEQHYQPQHAILSIVGNFSIPSMRKKVIKYFGAIPNSNTILPIIEQDSEDMIFNSQRVYRQVPANRLIKIYRVAARTETNYYTATLLGDILGGGKSALIREELVEKQGLCTKCQVSIFAMEDAGLLIIDLTIKNNVSFQEVEDALELCLDKVHDQIFLRKNLQKVKNNIYSEFITQDLDITDTAEDLAYHTFLGLDYDPKIERQKYNSINAQAIQDYAKQRINKNRAISLEYQIQDK